LDCNASKLSETSKKVDVINSSNVRMNLFGCNASKVSETSKNLVSGME
jgi:hypothetical protein